MKTIKKILVLSFLLLTIGGCSMMSGKKKNIEERLNDKYGIEFKIKKTWGSKTGYTSFIATPKDNPQHEFEGRLNPNNGSLTDSYIDSFVASQMAEYLTEEFQEVIPGVIFMVQPSGVRYKDVFMIDQNISMSAWLDDNYENALQNNGSSMHMSAYALIPYEQVDEIDFNQYKNKVEDIFQGEMRKVEMFYMKGSFLFLDEEMKEEMLAFYTYGKIDDTLLLRMEVEKKESGDFDIETIKRGNKISNFTFADPKLEPSFPEFRFRYMDEGISDEQ